MNAQRILARCIVGGLVLVVAARVAAPWYVRTRMLPEEGRKRGLEVTADDVRLPLFVSGGAVEFEGLRVASPGGGEMLAATRARIDRGGGAPHDVVLDLIELEGATLHVVVGSDGKTNLDALAGADPVRGAGMGAGTSFLLRELRVADCAVVVHDPTRKPGAPSIDVRRIRGRAVNLQVGPATDARLAGEATFDADWTQPGGSAPVSVVAWARPDGPAPTFTAHAVLTDLDLRAIPQYVDETKRALLGAERIDLVASMDVSKGVIREGAVVGRIPGRSEPLVAAFSGPLDAPVTDASGSLTALFELPFARLGTVGTVAWETGSSVVGGAVGFVKGLAGGDVAGAGGSILSGIGDAASALGRGAKDVAAALSSVFGIEPKDARARRDVAAVHAAVRSSLVLEQDRALGR
ncbi:MAG: hypothetical protein HMLKMBBP_01268 [Planctomycetes bacterium]|nr:hypothetical protein [Planctomycetota bacterium]